MKKLIIAIMGISLLSGCVSGNISSLTGNKIMTVEKTQPKEISHYKPVIVSDKSIIKLKKSLKENMEAKGAKTYGESRAVMAFDFITQLEKTKIVERVYVSINKYPEGNRVVADIYSILNHLTEDEIVIQNTTAENLVKYQMILEEIK